ncbi:MAG TPA: MarR family transcriptional regulator [Anaerolineae bacterium]|jgi:MarR family transcriptional regulator for hemolysin
MTTPQEACATIVLEVVPMIMRNIRREMRKGRDIDLSVPQFRSLAFLSSNEGVSLSDVAEHIGLSLPSASKLIDGLVNRNLVSRKSSEDDRRRVMLSLTPLGRTTLQVSVHATETYLTKRLASIPESDCLQIQHALMTIRPLFELSTTDNQSPDRSAMT